MEGLEAQLEGSEGQLEGSKGQLEGFKGQLEGSESQPRGEGRTDKQRHGWKISPFYRALSPTDHSPKKMAQGQ